jgi:3-phosphoshikimate 1-carboxyvinyltransferase
LSSQGNNSVEIWGIEGASQDACAMRDALIELGVEIEIEKDNWTVHGVGVNGFNHPSNALDFQNSGTALRLLAIAATRIGEWVTIDGDATLEPRINRDFWTSLEIGIKFDSDERNLPMRIKGPIILDSLTLDVSKTSQHLSALVLSMPARSKPLNLTKKGELVSCKHAELSYSLAAKCGSTNSIDDSMLKPWKCEPPNHVQIPADASHFAFWKLYEMLHNTTVEWPDIDAGDSIGAEVLEGLNLYDSQTINLRNSNDLITPLAAAMAIGGGGEIVGASHAQFKESDRIGKTVEMLAAFSIEVESTGDGLIISGNQNPTAPLQIVPTFGDHRMQMTAVILATKVGAEIEGATLHEVSFPEFLNFIQP